MAVHHTNTGNIHGEFMTITEFTESLIKPLIDFPNDLEIETFEENGQFTVTVGANTEDVGKIIGKKGGNANAIRKLLKTFAAKEHKKRITFTVSRD